MPDTITIRRPDDFHVHLRQGKMLEAVLPYTARQFGRALVMPNTNPPILTAQDAVRYREEILGACEGRYRTSFEPLLAIQIVPETTPAQIREARAAGVVAGKIYPRGMTTNSENGVLDYEALAPVYTAMQECGMVLSLHGESPNPEVFCLDRETVFLQTLSSITDQFPHLRVVLEHITTRVAVSVVEGLPQNVAATITVHHLFLTLDDVVGGHLKPHYFCKPLAKRRSDRDAVARAAMSGNPKFFLGTDSAPHPRESKECAACSAGIFTAPVALPLLAEFFERHGQLEKLEGFTSTFGARFYGLPRNTQELELVRREPAPPQELPTAKGVVFFAYPHSQPKWRLQFGP